MRNQRTLLLPLTTAMLLAPPAAAQEVRDYGRAHFHQDLAWSAPSGEGSATGLFLMEISSAIYASRVLAQDPSGRTLRITRILNPRSGVDSGELLDDATGWSAILDVDMGLTAESLGAYYAAGDEITLGDGTTVHMTLRTSDGLRFEHALALEASPEMNQAFVDALAGKGLAAGLAQALPEGLPEAVLFLNASLSPNLLQEGESMDNLAYGTRGVVEVLAHALRSIASDNARSTAPAERWMMTVSGLQKERLEPYQLEFVSRFRSVENVDPLSDLRLGEFLPPFGP